MEEIRIFHKDWRELDITKRENIQNLLVLCNYDAPTTEKYSSPQRWQILQKQFFEAFDWFIGYNRGRFLIYGKRD